MEQKIRFDYFYGKEADTFTFYRIPKLLFTEPMFKGLSSEAKILYDRLKPWYMEWFYYCKRRKKRIIYTYDCSEMMYSAMQTLGNLKPQAIMVGIPKAGQNRNLETIRVLD